MEFENKSTVRLSDPLLNPCSLETMWLRIMFFQFVLIFDDFRSAVAGGDGL